MPLDGLIFLPTYFRMASASLNTDSCSYQEQLRRSIGPGMYMLGTPANDCGGNSCKRDVSADPYLRYQAWGPGTCAPGAAVDDGSELRGLNYKSSKCSADSYLPGKYKSANACAVPGNTDPRACVAPTENTRLSNPPCTLRGTGWNRWEWLCWDPQERATIPFEWNVSYRIVAKDNHTPCIERPMDQSDLLPPPTSDDVPHTVYAGCGAQAPGNPFDAAFMSNDILSKL